MRTKYPIILGSKSPRRHEILTQAGFSVKVQASNVSEATPPEIPLNQVAAHIALQKAKALHHFTREHILITADTTVIFNEKLFGKPSSKKEAIQMLSSLSGASHEVITAFCIWHQNKQICEQDSTQVCFDQLDEIEISYYLDRFLPIDKAGAYGIQDWIGLIGIKKIVGSYYTVMGLPIHLIYQHLKKQGWNKF